MWVEVKYKQELKVGDKIRVKFTGHEATISKIVGKPIVDHCLCYHIEPRDPKDSGGHWYFSHNFELFSKKEKFQPQGEYEYDVFYTLDGEMMTGHTKGDNQKHSNGDLSNVIRCDIRHHGALVIDHAYMFQDGENVCAIAVEMKSKRGDIMAIGSDNGIPDLTIEAGEGSLNLNEDVGRDEPTMISFPDFKGWDIWSANISKYTIAICMVRRHHSV